jgi:Phytanoyl-CoA dioxygenase (PhyH)
MSFSLLILSVVVALRMNGDGAAVVDLPPFSTYESLGPIPALVPPRIYNVPSSRTGNGLGVADVTDEMRIELERDGAICVRGLIADALLERLDAETAVIVDEQLAKDRGRTRRGTQFHTVAHSAIFRGDLQTLSQEHDDTLPPKNKDDNATGSTLHKPSALMEVSLWSPVPAFAAALLNVTSIPGATEDIQKDKSSTDDSVETLRLIRDIFLTKDDDSYVCGWHTDDLGFWPATPESPGINAWIALDDMEITEETGGFALAVQSHTAPWKEAAYYWTGASTNFPDGGYTNASHMFAHRTGMGTCNLQKAAPHIHRRMEETKRIYPVKRGDVIFHTRWLFHGTIAVERPGEKRIYRRYSVRYGPGSTSIIPPGYGTELSVLWDAANGGRSADSVGENDGPWYPQAWPPMADEVESRFWKDLEHLVQEKLPVAEQRRDKRKQEMKPFLKRMAKEQQRLSTHGQ